MEYRSSYTNPSPLSPVLGSFQYKSRLIQAGWIAIVHKVLGCNAGHSFRNPVPIAVVHNANVTRRPHRSNQTILKIVLVCCRLIPGGVPIQIKLEGVAVGVEGRGSRAAGQRAT